MNFIQEVLSQLSFLIANFGTFASAGGWKYIVMWAIGGILIYLAIRHDMEPTLLLPMGFGTILVNIPSSGAITQLVNGEEVEVLFQPSLMQVSPMNYSRLYYL